MFLPLMYIFFLTFLIILFFSFVFCIFCIFIWGPKMGNKNPDLIIHVW